MALLAQRKVHLFGQIFLPSEDDRLRRASGTSELVCSLWSLDLPLSLLPSHCGGIGFAPLSLRELSFSFTAALPPPLGLCHWRREEDGCKPRRAVSPDPILPFVTERQPLFGSPMTESHIPEKFLFRPRNA